VVVCSSSRIRGMKFVNCRNKKRTEQIVSGNNNLFPRENLIFNCFSSALRLYLSPPNSRHGHLRLRHRLVFFVVSLFGAAVFHHGNSVFYDDGRYWFISFSKISRASLSRGISKSHKNPLI